MSLSEHSCLPCQKGMTALKKNEADILLEELGKNWKIQEEGHLYKSFDFPNFMKAMDFSNQIASLAEKEGHHPNLKISWGKCEVEIWTHKLNGLSKSDFFLAAKIDKLL
ncbi:MAG: 4a-hydroxytetrahydrobiopterin dehydratase [Proteobacteria bacterium]|nr:4a-hydroxytetrahydrobiopterin dehydratase [Pseudomonadota bacterium]